jgi:phage shock protein A
MITLLAELVIGIIALVVVLDIFTGFKMAKSILNRLHKKADDIAELSRDPISDAYVALENIKKERVNMTELRRNLLVEVKQANLKGVRANAEVSKYEELATLAGNAGNSDDVRLALERKANAEKQVTLAKNDAVRLTTQEDRIEEKIKEFDLLIEKATNDQTYLESSLKINKFNTQVNNLLKGNNGSAVSALEKLREDVDKSAAEAEASGELADESKSLENKYISDAGVRDDDIAKYLKKK